MNPFAPFARFVAPSIRSGCAQPRPAAAVPCPVQTRTLHMTIDAASITPLRQLAMRLCGDAFECMRIAICAGGARIQVWLCVQQPFADLLGAAIVQRFPGARMGAHAEGGAQA